MKPSAYEEAAFPGSFHDGTGSVGMTLRDWFAGQAVCGMLSVPQSVDGPWKPDQMARSAYVIADALMKDRETE